MSLLIEKEKKKKNKKQSIEDFDFQDEFKGWEHLNDKYNSVNKGLVKRGEKETVPDGSDYQKEIVFQAREAMYKEITNSVRGHNVKQILKALWVDELKKAIIFMPKKNFFRDIGDTLKLNKQTYLSLNPFEIVYLVERGSAIAYLNQNDFFNKILTGFNLDFNFDESCPIIDLAFLYTLAFSSHRYLIEEYQIYSYLKRYGFIVREFKKINDQSETENHKLMRSKNHFKIFNLNFYTNFLFFFLKKQNLKFVFNQLKNLFYSVFPVRKKLHTKKKNYLDYEFIFKKLRLENFNLNFNNLKNSKNQKLSCKKQSEYKITFNVWKPLKYFSKLHPPIPDFHVCVINTETSKFPFLSTFHYLLNSINYDFENQKNATKKKDNYRSIVIAVLDNGVINFISLSEYMIKTNEYIK